MSTTFETANTEASIQAIAATTEFFNEQLKGQDRPMCGFSAVVFYPTHKGNTKLGREERKLVESIGFRKDYTGKNWRMSNPGRYRGQNVDAQYAGSAAYAAHMKAKTGMNFTADSRLD